MASFVREFAKGIVISNPIFILALGLCPALAVSNTIDNALGMSVGVIFVLLGANIIISLIRKSVPNIVRIPTFIVIIATFVTIVSLLFQAYVPALHESLGIYLPLIAVNCIILGRAESFASKNPVTTSIADALGISVGFALALLLIALLREILGTDSLSVAGASLFTLPVLSEHPLALFVLSPGAFLVIGLLLALFRRIGMVKHE
ncbi:MAG: electron transport complex subunit RsxE [Dehalococcoidales bacterium]|nr:electron transport complex subunit RsxE [Dehalococcoidales bacterium]